MYIRGALFPAICCLRTTFPGGHVVFLWSASIFRTEPQRLTLDMTYGQNPYCERAYSPGLPHKAVAFYCYLNSTKAEDNPNNTAVLPALHIDNCRLTTGLLKQKVGAPVSRSVVPIAYNLVLLALSVSRFSSQVEENKMPFSWHSKTVQYEIGTKTYTES